MSIDILTAAERLEMERLIAEGQRIVLCAHQNPDGDAVGACLGLRALLQTLGKETAIVLPDMFPDYLKWMPHADSIVVFEKQREEAKRLMDEADLVFCLDFNSAERLADMAQLLEDSDARRVMIDHHPCPELPVEYAVTHPEMSSTCEVLFRIAWQMGWFGQVDSDFAVPVYCGMMTDTGGFQYNSNSSDIYFIICQLLTKGIDKDKIYRNVYNNYSYNRMRLLGFVLYKRLKYVAEKGVAYFILNRGDLMGFHFMKGDLEGVVNMPLQIKGCRLSMSFREDSEKKDTVWVSLRSVDDFSCTEFAQRHFNGGGHHNASGGRLYCRIYDVESIVLNAISELPDVEQTDNSQSITSRI